MGNSKQVTIHIVAHAPPLVSYSLSFKASPEAILFFLVQSTIENSKGPTTFSPQGAADFAGFLNYYDRAKERFVDKYGTIASQHIDDGGVIIASLSNDAKVLNELVQMRKMTMIDQLASDIYKGK